MITSTAVSAVATLLSIPMSTMVVLVDVMSSVVLPSIVDEALLVGHHFLTSRGRPLMNGHLPLIPGWLDAFFCGCPSTSRG